MRALLALLAVLTLAPAARAVTVEGLSQGQQTRSVNVTTTSANVTHLNVAIGTVTAGVTLPVSLGTATIAVTISTPLAVSVAASSCPTVTVSTGQVLSASTLIVPGNSPPNRCGCLLSNDSDTKGFSGLFTVGASGAPLGAGQAVRAGQTLSIDMTPGVYSGSLFAISNTTATYSLLCTSP